MYRFVNAIIAAPIIPEREKNRGTFFKMAKSSKYLTSRRCGLRRRIATVGFSSERIKKVFLTVERWPERGGGRFKGPEFWSGISSTFSRQPSSDLSCPSPPPWPSLTSQYYYDERRLVELSAPLETTTQVVGKHDNCSNRKGTGVKSPWRSI